MNSPENSMEDAVSLSLEKIKGLPGCEVIKLRTPIIPPMRFIKAIARRVAWYSLRVAYPRSFRGSPPDETSLVVLQPAATRRPGIDPEFTTDPLPWEYLRSPSAERRLKHQLGRNYHG